MPVMSEVTRILEAASQGDPHAADQVLPLVYDELRRLAAARLAHESPGQTLQATALVHEAYVRLVAKPAREGGGQSLSDSRPEFANRAHFFAAAAEAMRRILVEAARRKNRLKHGGGLQRVDLEQAPGVDAGELGGDLIALSDALDALEREDPDKARLVKLRYFAGLTLEDAAATLGISLATAKRRWVVARAWLYERISGSGS